jgi:hypothetical protein
MCKKLFVLLFTILIGIVSKGSIQTQVFNLPGYGNYNVIIYTPDNTTGSLPAVIFFPGSGESTTNPNDLYTNGPLHYIQGGWKPDFIVVGVQMNNGLPGPNSFVEDALKKLVSSGNYRIDPDKFYYTGLSYGAATIFQYIQGEDTSFFHPAAVVPMSINVNGLCNNGNSLCGNDLRFASIPAWGFCGSSDNFYTLMTPYFQLLTNAGYTVKFTTFVGGHCCWNTFYDPTYKEQGLSIYDWMMQFPANSLPITWGYFQYDPILNELEWSLLTQENADHFEIEESDDGKNWQTIGTLPIDSQTNYTYKL